MFRVVFSDTVIQIIRVTLLVHVYYALVQAYGPGGVWVRREESVWGVPWAFVKWKARGPFEAERGERIIADDWFGECRQPLLDGIDCVEHLDVLRLHADLDRARLWLVVLDDAHRRRLPDRRCGQGGFLSLIDAVALVFLVSSFRVGSS